MSLVPLRNKNLSILSTNFMVTPSKKKKKKKKKQTVRNLKVKS